MTPKRLLAHRIAWLTCYPLLAWWAARYLAFSAGLSTGQSVLAVAGLLLFPLGLFVRWEVASPYRARTYCYAAGIALGGVLLACAGFLLLVMSMGGGNWR